MNPAIKDSAPATAADAEERGDVMADMAILIAVLAEQLMIASTESEHWFLGFFESLTAIEERASGVRRSLPSAREDPEAADAELAEIESLALRALQGLQVQDMLRQQLGSVTAALGSLEHQCKSLALRRSNCTCAPEHGQAGDVAAILTRLERTYVMQAQRAAHFRAITLRAVK